MRRERPPRGTARSSGSGAPCRLQRLSPARRLPTTRPQAHGRPVDSGAVDAPGGSTAGMRGRLDRSVARRTGQQCGAADWTGVWRGLSCGWGGCAAGGVGGDHYKSPPSPRGHEATTGRAALTAPVNNPQWWLAKGEQQVGAQRANRAEDWALACTSRGAEVTLAAPPSHRTNDHSMRTDATAAAPVGRPHPPHVRTPVNRAPHPELAASWPGAAGTPPRPTAQVLWAVVAHQECLAAGRSRRVDRAVPHSHPTSPDRSGREYSGRAGRSSKGPLGRWGARACGGVLKLVALAVAVPAARGE